MKLSPGWLVIRVVLKGTIQGNRKKMHQQLYPVLNPGNATIPIPTWQASVFTVAIVA